MEACRDGGGDSGWLKFSGVEHLKTDLWPCCDSVGVDDDSIYPGGVFSSEPVEAWAESSQ